ncbi:MAG: HD-GYP domain-containing protein [Halieaceae bacterium]|nr:HD-GYP domain-containing protein [Halieaceae bacterium]
MRLVKIPAMNLRPGMFVAELDRPWLETPFAVQGFVVRNSGEVHYIADHVDYVMVDVEYTGSPVFLSLVSEPTISQPSSGLALKADFQQTKQCFESATDTLDKVFESLREGHRADINVVKEAINPLLEGVFRNQEAVAALLRLKECGDYRYHHGISMALWGAILGRHLGLHRDELEKLAVGCAMCDVGMTELPIELLDQPEALSPKQRAIVKAHATIGAEMVSESNDIDFEILAIIENHHERMNGSGYPRGLEGASIPLMGRIAGLVDAYDAMITARPYAPARTSHEAVQELLDNKGSLFQEAMVEQFVQAIGLFPTGTLVELNTGDVGIVVKQNSTRRLKPEIVIVLCPEKNKKDILGLVDLADQELTENGERWITRELLPGSFGINNEEYFI